MKIIDILNKMANGELEDGFKFKHDNDVYKYNKKENKIVSDDEYGTCLGNYHIVESILNDEVEAIEEKKEIEELPNELIGDDWTYHTTEFHNKINEVIRAINKLNKEREEK